MKKIFIIVFLSVLSVFLFGCVNSPLVGTWYYSDDVMEDMRALSTDPSDVPEYAFEIKPNGRAIGNPQFGSVVMTYKIEGDQVTFLMNPGTPIPR